MAERDKWTYEDEQQIIFMLRQGKNLGEIARVLDRSLGAIEARIEQMASKKRRLLDAINTLKEAP